MIVKRLEIGAFSPGVNQIVIKAGILAGVLALTLAAKLLPLFPSLRGMLGPLGAAPILSQYILYLAPFIFLGYCLATGGRLLRWSYLDLFYGGILIIQLTSFFWMNRGFHPVNLMLGNLSVFFLFLLIRNLPLDWGRNHLLFLIMIPAIPILGEAIHGLAQLVSGAAQISGSLYNYNFFGQLIAMLVPLAASQILTSRHGWAYRLAALVVTGFLAFIILKTTSRTSILGLILALSIALLLYFLPELRETWQGWSHTARIIVGGSLVAASGLSLYLFYSIRPLSVWGRLLLVKIGLRIFSQHPFTGIGFGEIHGNLARYQGEYFTSVGGGDMERILAGGSVSTFNGYLETAIETGIVGLLLYIPFWLLVLWTGVELIKGEKMTTPPSGDNDHRLPFPLNLGKKTLQGDTDNMLGFGIGAALVLFMLMSIPYAPVKIPQVWIVFNYILGIALLLKDSRAVEGEPR